MQSYTITIQKHASYDLSIPCESPVRFLKVTFPVRGSRILHKMKLHTESVLELPGGVQDELVQSYYT